MNNNKTLKIIISGGGTGGHLFPAIAIGDILKKYNHQIIYIGSKYGIEANNDFFNENKSYLINIKGLARTITIKNGTECPICYNVSCSQMRFGCCNVFVCSFMYCYVSLCMFMCVYVLLPSAYILITVNIY